MRFLMPTQSPQNRTSKNPVKPARQKTAKNFRGNAEALPEVREAPKRCYKILIEAQKPRARSSFQSPSGSSPEARSPPDRSAKTGDATAIVRSESRSKCASCNTTKTRPKFMIIHRSAR
jgi:hypothetical protein